MRWSINLSRIYHVQLMWPSSYCIWICIADGFISSFRCLLHIYFNRQQNGISMVLCLLLQPSTIIVQWPDKRKNESRHIDESVRLNEWCEWTDEQKKRCQRETLSKRLLNIPDINAMNSTINGRRSARYHKRKSILNIKNAGR